MKAKKKKKIVFSSEIKRACKECGHSQYVTCSRCAYLGARQVEIDADEMGLTVDDYWQKWHAENDELEYQ